MRQHIHEQGGDVPPMDVVPESPLKVIAGIQEDRIRPFLDESIDRRVDSGDPTHTVLLVFLVTGPGSRARLLEPST